MLHSTKNSTFVSTLARTNTHMLHYNKLLTALLLYTALLFFSHAQGQSTRSKKDKKNNSAITLKQEAEYQFTEGMKEFIIDNLPRALSAFEKSLQYDPANAAAHFMIAQTYERQGNFYKALLSAQKAIQLNDANKYYYLLLARIYDRKQDYYEEIKVYQQLLKKIPDAYEYYFELAAVYSYVGKWEDAIKCYDKYEKYAGITEEISRQKQQIYLKLGKINDAINEARKLAAAFPEDVRYMIVLAELLISHQKNDEAEKILQEVLKKDPLNPYVNISLYSILTSKGKTNEANQKLMDAFSNPLMDIDTKVGILITKIRQLPNEDIKKLCLNLGKILADVHPNEAKAHAMYADILAISNQNKDALNHYLQAVKLDPGHYKIWQQIVIINYELNSIDSLIKHSERALELYPNQSIFWFYNGIAYQLKKNYKKSAASFEQGKKLAANDKNLLVQFNSLLGDTYNGLKEYKKSDECFEEALRYDENNHVVLNNYSYYLSLRKEKLEQAKRMSEKVIKEFPDNPTYLDTYAWILYVMKDYAKAKDIFEKIADTSNNGTIVEHYGDVLYQLGQKDKALEQWKKARELGDASEWIDKKIAEKKLYE